MLLLSCFGQVSIGKNHVRFDETRNKSDWSRKLVSKIQEPYKNLHHLSHYFRFIVKTVFSNSKTFPFNGCFGRSSVTGNCVYAYKWATSGGVMRGNMKLPRCPCDQLLAADIATSIWLGEKYFHFPTNSAVTFPHCQWKNLRTRRNSKFPTVLNVVGKFNTKWRGKISLYFKKY